MGSCQVDAKWMLGRVEVFRFLCAMRVAVNTRILLRDRLEGVGWFTYEVCRRLVARHPGWEFLFLFDRPFDPGFVFGSNVRGIVVPPPARHPLLWYLWFNVSLPVVFARERPDVFFSPDGHCSLRSRVPTAMVLHDIAHVHFPEQVPGAVRWFYDRYIPRYLERAEGVITVSEASRRDIHRYYGLPEGRIAVCGNGARPQFLPLADQEKEVVKKEYAGGQPYFFYLGSIHPRKNIFRLIKAFDRFKAATGAPVKLLIGGRFGWLTGETKAAYEEVSHREDIVFLGYVPEAELPRLLGGALALTYVSLFEGFGLPVLEAMQAEVPVITADTSSLPEVAGEAALLVDPESQEAIAKAMERIYTDSILRKKLIELGKVQRRKYSWEKTTEVIENELVKLKG